MPKTPPSTPNPGVSETERWRAARRGSAQTRCRLLGDRGTRPSRAGAGGTARQAAVFAREEARYHTPIFTGVGIGFDMTMAAVKRHGTPQQYDHFGTLTHRGDITWCQLFSEPSAGSDLAALRTRAVKDGDNWVVNGQKVWSSWAHHADWGILIARTDPAVAKHNGLTFFLVDMKSPGIEVRPIRQITGKSDFNETFLTDVVIPDANRVGAEGEGWACCMTVLATERNRTRTARAGGDRSGSVLSLIQQAAATPRQGGSALDSPAVRAKLARWYVREQGLKNFGRRLDEQARSGDGLPATVALVKLVSHPFTGNACVLMDSTDRGNLQQRETDLRRGFYQYQWVIGQRIAGGADEVAAHSSPRARWACQEDARRPGRGVQATARNKLTLTPFISPRLQPVPSAVRQT